MLSQRLRSLRTRDKNAAFPDATKWVSGVPWPSWSMKEA